MAKSISLSLPDEAGTRDQSVPPLSIEIDEQAGTVCIQDSRVFRAKRRGFCRSFLESIAAHPEAIRAEIELESATCRIEFESAWATRATMAEVVTQAIATALGKSSPSVWVRWWAPGAAWSSLTFYSHQDEVSTWETRHNRLGDIRFRHDSPTGGRNRIHRLEQELARIKPCSGCQVVRWSRRLTVECPDDGRDYRLTLDQVERVRGELDLDLTHALALSTNRVAGGDVELARGPRRFVYLGVAGGAFLGTIVGLVIPGIPTVPFLLATSYFLARSSPRLDAILRQSPFFGSILEEWEEHAGLSLTSKLKLAGLTLVIVAITLTLAPISPVLLAVVVTMSAISIYGVSQMPGIPSTDLPAPKALPAT